MPPDPALVRAWCDKADEFTRDDAVQAEAQAIQVKKIVLALLLERGYR